MKKSVNSQKPKVSVVVPIYNVEKYLRECIDSILGQTLKEIEVILVDDGSPDGCGRIIDDYAKQDARIVPIHQKNSGYSAAVNKGIDLARGEYIGIIESDDFIESNMYESLYQNAKKNETDITKGMFFFYNPTLPPSKQNKVWANPCGIDLRLAPDGPFRAYEWPQIIGFHSSIWSSLYRASFIKKIKIPETAGASYQDFPFMIEAMCRAKRISVVKQPFVHWRNEPKQNNSTSARGKKLLLMAQNTITGLKTVQTSGHYDELKEAFFAHALWTNIGFFYKISRKYKKAYYEELRRIFAGLKNDKSFSYKFFRPEDIKSVQYILKNENYIAFYVSHIIGGVRRRLRNILQRKQA
ncbi:glycosyltransferase [Candidatus Saccharibacteria bacterium]|nr:glycosyltransferase [Candidatus Saccharibacteria bacterium]